MAYKPLTREQYQNAINSGFSHQDIITFEKTRKAQEREGDDKGFLSRVWERYAQAGEDIISGIKRGAEVYEAGISEAREREDFFDPLTGTLKAARGLLRTGLRTVGGVAGAAFAPITEAPVVKQALEFTGEQIAKIPGVETIIQSLTELSEKHPEAAKDVQNVIDIAIIAGGRRVERPVGAKVTKAGVKIEKAGITSKRLIKERFSQSLVSPIEKGKVRLEQVGRTREAGGLFKRDIITPTRLELKSAKEVAKIPGISAKNTFQKNFNLVRDYNVKQAKQLADDIAKYDFTISKKYILGQLDDAAVSLRQSPLIVGDAEKMANKLLAGAKKFIESNKASGSGLLKARKQFDAWVKGQKPKVFDAKADNAFTIANDKIRQTLNTILDEKAINLGIKDSLGRQSSLFTAMTNIAPKAAIEANTPLYRVLQRVGKILGTKNRMVQGIAAAVGIGGLGAAATFAPAAVVLGGVGFITYKAGRLVMSPQVRIALGRLLQNAGHLLSPAEKKIIQDAIKTYSK